MLENNWVLTEGVTDSENSSTAVCAKADDVGIQVGYIACDEVYVVTIKGIFDVCPMSATGSSQEEVISDLDPGMVAVPVVVNGKSTILTIDADYELDIKDGKLDDLITSGVIDIDNVDECVDQDEMDEDLKNLLGIM